MRGIGTVLLAIVTGASGCKQQSETERRVYQATPSATERQHPQPVTPMTPVVQHGSASDQVTWKAPASWQTLALTNPMRKASYRIPRTKGDSDDAELAVFYFGAGQGGSIQANVDRWLNQFSGVSKSAVVREQRTANGLRQHVIKLDHAEFNAGMPGGPTQPKANWGLLGAIVETTAGPYFFKITGPSATLKVNEKSFYEFLDTVKSAA